jgi:hypothetical protein
MNTWDGNEEETDRCYDKLPGAAEDARTSMRQSIQREHAASIEEAAQPDDACPGCGELQDCIPGCPCAIPDFAMTRQLSRDLCHCPEEVEEEL